MHYPTDRIAFITAFVRPVMENWLEREIVMWDRSNDPSEREQSLSHISGSRCSSVVERPLMVQWIVGSILHGGLIDLFLLTASGSRLV